jgi:uncharacterized protein YjbI with pentapeptide repeats
VGERDRRGGLARGLSSIRRHFRVSIDLSLTNLSGVGLRSVDLRAANLRDAVLVDADLENADLRKAVLVEANLQGACLNGADLSQTQATEAIFDRAHLRGVDIHKACLKGASVSPFTPRQLTEACVLPDEAPLSQQGTVRRVCKSISCVYSSS